MGREFGEGLRMVGVGKEEGGREGARWRKRVAVGGWGSRWREERRETGLGEGMPEKREDQVGFFFWLGQGRCKIESWEQGPGSILLVIDPHQNSCWEMQPLGPPQLASLQHFDPFPHLLFPFPLPSSAVHHLYLSPHMVSVCYMSPPSVLPLY